MSEVQYFYKEFISTVQRKIPQRSTLANLLTEFLDIDKDAVYRRLRGEVSFTFAEMAIIARKLGISLDSIAGIQTERTKPTQVVMTRHVNPTAIDYKLFSDYVDLLKLIKDEPNTKLMESGNSLPHNLFFDYEYLTRIYLFGWNMASSLGSGLKFDEIIIPEQFRVLQKDCCLYTRHLKSTQYVWDRSIFHRMVENIKFSAKIRLINQEDIDAIKYELTDLINHLERLAAKGKHEDTGNEVSIYISDLYLYTGYSCVESKNLHISQFKTFLLNSNSSFDVGVYNEVSTWIQALQKMSTLITVSGNKLRTEYFKNQRQIVNTL